MKFLISNLKLSEIVHNDLECYIKSGYGGKYIENWPFYNFIKNWVEGDCKNSRSMWINWLTNEFFKYKLEKKSNGGMYQGSVHRYALNFLSKNKQEYWINPSLLSESCVEQGAAMLIDRRIDMIRSIKNKGYQINLNDQIFAINLNTKYVLKGGHHRAVVMRILGYNELPGVLVYSKPLWECRKWLIKIKKYIN